MASDAHLLKYLGTVTGSSVVEICNGVAKIKIKKPGNSYTAAVEGEDLSTGILQKGLKMRAITCIKSLFIIQILLLQPIRLSAGELTSNL